MKDLPQGMKSHLDEILKQFDEKFSDKFSGGNDYGMCECYENLPQIKSFLRTSLISLLEKYGEEIVGEDYKDDPRTNTYSIYGKDEQERRNFIMERQRTKLKEILSSLK